MFDSFFRRFQTLNIVSIKICKTRNIVSGNNLPTPAWNLKYWKCVLQKKSNTCSGSFFNCGCWQSFPAPVFNILSCTCLYCTEPTQRYFGKGRFCSPKKQTVFRCILHSVSENIRKWHIVYIPITRKSKNAKVNNLINVNDISHRNTFWNQTQRSNKIIDQPIQLNLAAGSSLAATP